jgi:hypothetical protein
MKTIKFFALTFLCIAHLASAKINVSAGIARGEIFKSGLPITLELEQRKMCYFDDNVYIEAELVEEKADHILLQFTVATKNESGSFIVRGLPRLSFPLEPQSRIVSGSLRCDGPSETFTLVVNVEKM